MPRKKLDDTQDTVVFSVRMPADLHEALSALAQRENRSLSQQVVYLLRQAMTPAGDEPCS